MYLYFHEIEELLELINTKNDEKGVLPKITDSDKKLLQKIGVDFRKVSIKEGSVFSSLNFAVFLRCLKDFDEVSLSYKNLYEYIQNCEYSKLPVEFLHVEEVEELLKIIGRNHVVVGGSSLAVDDRKTLLKYGIDFSQVSSLIAENISTPFNLGMLAKSLRVAETNNYSYKQLIEYVKKGRYIPPSSRETLLLERVKELKLGFMGSEEGIIRQEIIEDLNDGKTTKQIASDLGHKTGYWGFEDILNRLKATVFEEARVLDIKERNPTVDPHVFKWVSKNGCCSHCTRLYLTKGVTSEPKIFRLSELERNGSNEGKSEWDWKPTIYPTHDWCSCSIYQLPNGYLWNPDKQSFSTPDPEYKKKVAASRSLIRVWINGVEKWL
jgi:hypothetical protein